MKQAFCQENIGQLFPVLWEGYSEPQDNGKQRVFGYTPNYLKVACIINSDESIENQTLMTQLMTVEDGYMVGYRAEIR